MCFLAYNVHQQLSEEAVSRNSTEWCKKCIYSFLLEIKKYMLFDTKKYEIWLYYPKSSCKDLLFCLSNSIGDKLSPHPPPPPLDICLCT